MNEEQRQLALIYDSLSDHDKKSVGMIGLSFIIGLHDRIKDVFWRCSDVKKDN